MKSKLLIIAAIAALPMLAPTTAQARDTCREYSKTIRINGHLEVGYGTACRRDRDTWEIVNLNGRQRARNIVKDYIYHDLRDHGYRVVVLDNHYNDRRYNYDRGYYSSYRNAYYYPKNYSHYKKKYKSSHKTNHKRSHKQNRAHYNGGKKFSTRH